MNGSGNPLARYRIPQAVLTNLNEAGLGLDAVATGTGIDPRRMVEPVPVQQRDIFLTKAATRLPAGSGLSMGLATSAERLGLVGLAAMSRSTFGAALTILARYSTAMTGDELVLVQNESETSVQFRAVEYSWYALRQTIERELAATVAIGRRLTGTPLCPVRASFAYSAPEYHDRYRKVFGCPARFGQPVNEVVFKNSDLALPLITASTELADLFGRHAAQSLLIDAPHEDVVVRARAAMQRALFGHAPDAAEIARALRTTPAKLGSQLREGGTSFRPLLEEVRKERALHVTRHGAESMMPELGYLLGLDVRSLKRSFRHWTGMTLKAYRESVQNGRDTRAADDPGGVV